MRLRGFYLSTHIQSLSTFFCIILFKQPPLLDSTDCFIALTQLLHGCKTVLVDFAGWFIKANAATFEEHILCHLGKYIIQ